MTNRPESAPTSMSANGSRWAIAAALATVLLALGCGSEQHDFRFQFRGPADHPVAGVQVYYLADDDTVTVGRSDIAGNLIVDRKYLAQLPRTFEFRLPSTHVEAATFFDADRCEMIHSATAASYRADRGAGSVGPADLAAIPDGWRQPGRIVKLDLAASGEAGEPEVLYTRSMMISTVIRTTPGARVTIDDVVVGEANPDGELVVSFCWWHQDGGDYVPRSEIEIEIARPGYLTWRRPIPISDDGRMGAVVRDLERIAETAEPVEPVEPVESFVNLRVKHSASTVRSCGSDGMALPNLYVNDESTIIPHLPSNAMGTRVWFDLVVKAGQEYCLAVACPDWSDETSWFPWNASANAPRWYRLRVPPDAREMVVLIADDHDPSQPLHSEPGEVPSNFDAASSRTIKRGCR